MRVLGCTYIFLMRSEDLTTRIILISKKITVSRQHMIRSEITYAFVLLLSIDIKSTGSIDVLKVWNLKHNQY